MYPDGIIDQQWIAKHQYHLPSAVILLLPFTADSNTSSLLDNKLKSEINSARSTLASANYKTRLVVILLGDEVIAPTDVEERIGIIRKATLLDQKALFFIPTDSSHEELSETIRSLLTSLHPQCVEYYRDLSKRARRKRNRNATPQPTIAPTTAHVLSSQGWVVRYEYKLGVFAEFRQEMDAACRNYESAYESLFAPEVIESIASWSPRFNQARLLADIIAIRILRCLLWTNQHTAAAKMWTKHTVRMEGVLDRRGKGTETYSWEAWQSTWSKTMADLLTRAEIPAHKGGSATVFVAPDPNAALLERSLPIEQLHHQGYWYRSASEHSKRRRKFAAKIPEEDRQPSARSPVSKLPNAAQNYDTYLVPEPHKEMPFDGSQGFDHHNEILLCLDIATEHFAKHGQERMQHLLQLDRAKAQIASQSWADVVETLLPLWEQRSWREAGWWQLLGSIGWTLLECARESGNPEVTLRLLWEIANICFQAQPAAIFDLAAATADYSGDEKLSLVFTSQDSAVRLASSFIFATAEGHVGDAVDCQLVLISVVHPGVPSVGWSQVKIAFEGELKPVLLSHSDEPSAGERSMVTSANVALEESTQLIQASKRSSTSAFPSSVGRADLTLGSREIRIFNFLVTPREAGELFVASITAFLEGEKYAITEINTDVQDNDGVWWETKGEIPSPRNIGVQRAAASLLVLPKPPKVEIDTSGFKKCYYTNEKVQIDLLIINNEEEVVVSTVNARLISPLAQAPAVTWTDQIAEEETHIQDTEQTLPVRSLQQLAAGTSGQISLSIAESAIAVDHELEIVAEYHMISDPSTTLRKSLTLDVAIIRPFEANYDFTPRQGTEEWPSFFESPSAGVNTPSGLIQTFAVAANLVSFTVDPVVIEAILLTTSSITGGAVCSSTTGVLKDTVAAQGNSGDKISTSIAPEETKTFNFDLTIHKLVLGDRDTVALDLALEIGWRRPDSDVVNSTILEVPRFVNPMAEPRVLLTAGERGSVPGQEDMHLIDLHYTIENPSMHFLTFNIAMEASEDFAFSGPKSSAVSLVPMSKYDMAYRILPNRRDTESSRERKKGREKNGEWLKVQLNVVDAYFNQTLRVQAAGDGVKLDKKGNIIVLTDA